MATPDPVTRPDRRARIVLTLERWVHRLDGAVNVLADRWEVPLHLWDRCDQCDRWVWEDDQNFTTDRVLLCPRCWFEFHLADLDGGWV